MYEQVHSCCGVLYCRGRFFQVFYPVCQLETETSCDLPDGFGTGLTCRGASWKRRFRQTRARVKCHIPRFRGDGGGRDFYVADAQHRINCIHDC